jgi:hypothetical protein
MVLCVMRSAEYALWGGPGHIVDLHHWISGAALKSRG